MESQIPNYLTSLVLTTASATVAVLLFVLHHAVKLAKWPARDRALAFWGGALLFAAWFFASLWLSWLGFFRGSPSSIPTIQYGVLIPIIVGVALFWWRPTVRRVIETVPQEWLVGVQVYRALGFIFLLLYAGGRLPGLFALPAGIGDVFVGLFAPIVGISYAGKRRNAAGFVRAWNLFGIADLITALTTGFLTSPSPIQKFALDAPNRLVTAFPLVMIPVFLVPLSILLHLASLWKLRQSRKSGAHSAPESFLVSGKS